MFLFGFGLKHIEKFVCLHFNGFLGFGNEAISSLEIGLELFDELFFNLFILLVFEFVFKFFLVLKVEESLFAMRKEHVPIEVKRMVYFFELFSHEDKKYFLFLVHKFDLFVAFGRVVGGELSTCSRVFKGKNLA